MSSNERSVAEVTEVEGDASPLQAKRAFGVRSFVLPAVIVVLAVSLYMLMAPGIPREIRGLGGVLGMMMIMFLGVPVAVAMATAGGIGLVTLVGFPALVSAYKDLPFRGAANWTFSVLPMFVLMGVVLWRSGVTDKMFMAAKYWLNWLPGSLAVATNFAGAGLAAASGSTMGISFALARLAVPEMLKAGYDRGLASAVVTMAGTLGQLIPPSILLVIYAGIAQVPVGPLLLAAIVPGFMTAFAYGGMIVLRSMVQPHIAPKINEVVTWPMRWNAAKHVWPVPFLVFIIIGGLFSGVFTATEAGAYAAGAAIIIAYIFSGRKATGQVTGAVIDTVAAMGSILILIMGVTLLNRFLALSGMPVAMAGWIDQWGLDRVQFLFVVMVLYLIMGMFMDPLAIMLLTIPVFTPTFAALQIDLIWYGIFVVAMGELALVTPPVGVLVFLVHKLINQEAVRGKDSPPISLMTVFEGCAWFAATQLLILILLIFFPEIVHWLPSISSAQ